MDKKIKKAGIIGAGIMGSAIAAHLVNVGIETVLLDIVPADLTEEDRRKGLTKESRDFRNKLALKGVDAALKSNPASFYLPENSRRIIVGNIEDNLELLKEVDLIIEAVIERLDIKKSVFEKIESILTPGTIITSNTSGISVESMCDGRSDIFLKHFAVTHFFNPPRYMKLLEIVPGPDTLPEVMERLTEISDKLLGKGVVYAKDTPNFVANRIGTYSFFSAVRAMKDLGLTIEAVDLLTGPVIGHPKSASFRTADLVGLDTLVHVANNVYERANEDEKREMFKIPNIFDRMIEKGLLGEKTGRGFYFKERDSTGSRVILSLDFNSVEYVQQEPVRFASLETARNLSSVSQRIKALFFAEDTAGEFTFQTLTETLIYSANRIPEIADNIVSVDNAMKWGFAWKLGPFEIWDEIGLEKSIVKIKDAGYEIPSWVLDMLNRGLRSFYKSEAGKLFYYDLLARGYEEVPVKPGIILLPTLKDREKKVAGNKGASLIDIGDGVACLEFHTKMNAMGDDIINMVLKSTDEVCKNFEGLVIA
ncbi:MAG: 3-hydroxyacyl-CoA dehydrogenase, partial [Deltaproteobacteria bacterium]|nr:3-hydroxyacyl-CoA dehydrogenase [Deltaproteobacteria bacterium]